MIRPAKVIIKPTVFISVVYFLFTFAWVVDINTTLSILVTPLYGFGPKQIGFLYFAPVIAAILGEIAGHWLHDFIATIYMRRHAGTLDPEARLLAIYVATPFMLAGLVLIGFCLEYSYHYMITAVAWGLYVKCLAQILKGELPFYPPSIDSITEPRVVLFGSGSILWEQEKEIREGLQRPFSRDYYYIDYHATVDAVKYRVLHTTAKVKQMFKPLEEKKDFYCPYCKAQWTLMETIDNSGPSGFLCHRCGQTLEREEHTAGDAAGSEKQVKLAAQLERVLKLLQEIDNATIPKSDFETALSLQVPVQRNQDVNPMRSTVPIEAHNGAPTAVKGVDQPVLQNLTVDLTSSSGKTASEKLAEQQRNAAIAAQNMLPVWHTQSTVTGNLPIHPQRRTKIHGNSTSPNGVLSSVPKSDTVEKDKKNGIISATDENDELAAYYTRMAQEKEKEEREDREDEASSAGEEEAEEEFEDIGIFSTASGSLPSMKAEETGTPKPRLGSTSSAKELMSESGSSAPVSVMTTPVAAPDDHSPAAKKVKLEVVNGNEDKPGIQAVSDEDEDADFEDAL
ncbi:MAG: hypothetical protein Q9221_000283 [Calogaya cf. arnoldii]